MGKFENGVLGMIPATDWLDLSNNIDVSRPNDPIDRIWGDIKTDNIMAEWETIKSQYLLPTMAYFHGFDTEAHTAIRMPIETHNIEKGLIKEKINQSERLRALWNRGEQRESKLYEYTVNDALHRADAIITRSKVAKYEIMATGKMTIKENNLDLSIDYGVPADQLNLTLDVGNGATKDVLAQIQDVIDQAADLGVEINGVMTTSKVITKMRNNAGLQKAINGNIGAGVQLRRSALESYLQDEYGIGTVISADLRYNVAKGIDAEGNPILETHRYFPEDKITFFATAVGGQMGTGLWGNPPEADRTDLEPANVSDRSPYVWISQKAEWDPKVVWTKASALYIPMLYSPNSIFAAAVTETPGA